MKHKQSRFVVPLLTTVVLLSGPGLSDATGQGLTPTQTKQVEEMIEDLDLALNGGTAKNNTRALATLQAAAMSPKATYEFFMEATRELDFDEAGKREADWREWKDRNEERLKSTEHVAALHYQIRYLILTLQVAMEKKEEEGLKKALPELIEFYDELAGNFEKLDEQHSVLSGSVLNSIFARKLKLDLTVQRSENWAASPLPVGTSYDQVILPHFRKEKNHRALQAAWDKRITQEGQTLAAASAPGGLPGRGPGRGFGRDPREREREEKREESRQKKVSIEEFKAGRLPILQWGKEVDGLLYGADPAGSFTALGRLLRENLAHPQAQDWLQELRILLKGGWNAESYYESGSSE